MAKSRKDNTIETDSEAERGSVKSNGKVQFRGGKTERFTHKKRRAKDKNLMMKSWLL